MPSKTRGSEVFQRRLGRGAEQQAMRIRLLQHLTLYGQWITGIERHGGQVEFGQGQQGNDVLDRGFEKQHHMQRRVVLSRQRMTLDQGRRQGVGQPIQFGIAHALLAGNQCGGVRSAKHLMLEPVGQGVERRRTVGAFAGHRQVTAIRTEQIVEGRCRGFQQQVEATAEQVIHRVHLRFIEVAALIFPPAFSPHDKQGQRAFGL